MPLIVDGIYEDTHIQVDIFIGGLTFEDGSLSKIIHVQTDLNQVGATLLQFYKVGLGGSNCHRLRVIQGSGQIAYFQ